MMRRAAKRAVREDSSDLSPPPEVIEAPAALKRRPATNKKIKKSDTTTTALDGAGIEKGTKLEVQESATTISSTKRSRKKQPEVRTEQIEAAAQADGAEPTPSKRGRKRKAVEYKEDEEEDDLEPEVKPSPRRSKKAKAPKAEEEDDLTPELKTTPNRSKKTKAVKTKDAAAAPLGHDGITADAAKPKRKRKTQEEKDAEAMPLAARTANHKMFIGAHVSSAGGVHNAIVNSVHIGANAFALFLKSQRKWANPPLSDEHCTSWHGNCKTHSYAAHSHVLPHGSYLVNLAHTDAERTKQAYDAFLDDLQRCERLGVRLYNFHPGNVAGKPRAEAIAHLAGNLNRAHKETKSVVTVLENMAAGGNVIGSTFEDLRDVIALVDDKERVGVCLDTCHAFAGGYDLRTPEALEATLKQLDGTVGMRYLKAMHLNDSKAPFESHRDLHANIGTGFLGLRAFHAIMNEPRFAGMPLVLETPIEVRDDDGNVVKDEKGKDKEDKGIWAREIKMLESFVDMDPESAEFLALETALARKGAPERARVQDQVYRREEKAKTESAKKGKKKKNKGKEESSEEGLSDLSS